MNFPLISIAFVGSLMFISMVMCTDCKVRERNRRKQIKPCQFPFKYDGETFHGCIDFDVDSNTGRRQFVNRRGRPIKPWCSTKVDQSTRRHTSGGGFFGDCDASCPSAEEAEAALNQNDQYDEYEEYDLNSDRNSGLWQPDGSRGDCGKRLQLSNIVGGKKAKIGDYPWMALLGYDFGNLGILYVCGGSVINKHYVLTAAHCVKGTQQPLSEVVLGEHKVGTDPDCSRDRKHCNPPKITRKIDLDRDVIYHENYQTPKKFSNDIALIRINEAIPLFQENPRISAVNPICLPWSEDDTFFAWDLRDGDKAKVAGWGRTRRRQTTRTDSQLVKDKAGSSVLKVAPANIAFEECVNGESEDGKRIPFAFDKESQICAGGVKGVDSCNGDSGGPLFMQEFASDPWYQVGLVSFGLEKCAKGLPGVYTRITHFLPWIKSNMKP